MENTHAHQTVESYELLALTTDGNDLTGSAKVEITVLNEFAVTIKTFGVPHSQFCDLHYDVLYRLAEAGYNTDRLSFNL